MKPPSHAEEHLDDNLVISPAENEQEQAPEGAGLQIIAERYQVFEKLGSGGMSTVYKVKHIHLNKVLALKLLQNVSESSVQRFQIEARAATLLEHPNIVRVYDFGITEGQPYMTMDCIKGESLAECLKKGGAINTGRLCRLFGQICGALSHAHEQGVVHRDLKPSNIILKCCENGDEQAIVVDFGIAKIQDPSESPDSHCLTRTGDIFGTPLYMSPEQSQGQKVDARSDIYSLACVMYEAATGKPPFQGDSVYQIIHKQNTEAPPPFPEHLRRTRAGRRLEALILSALAKAPGDRPKYMLVLSSELKAIENDDGGIWSDFKSLSAIISGRFKAAERKTVLLGISLRLVTALSCLIAILIVVLPPEIKRTEAQLTQQHEIIDAATAIFGLQGFGENAPRLFPRLRRLQSLCLSDPQQQDTCSQMTLAILKSVRKSNDLEGVMGRSYASQGLSLEEIKNTRHSVVTMIKNWSEATTKETKIVLRAQEKISSLEQKQHLMVFFFSLSWLSAPVWAFVLALLASRSWSGSRKVTPLSGTHLDGTEVVKSGAVAQHDT